MKKKKQKVTVGFISLGCPKNSVDSERMLAEIAEAGFLITAAPDTADVVVINTCGFIAPAKAESLEAIRNTIKHKLSGTVKKIIVTGCLPQREGEQLFNQADGIDAVVGLGQRDNIAGIIRKTLSHRHPAAYLNQPEQTIPDDRTRLLITPGHWAYLRISEGCNHRCSFCTIPAIRGRFQSKPLELVLSEADELVSAGAVELNIIAQDSTSYGRDLKIKNSLAGLISELENIAGLSWIRLMYLYPTEIDDKLINTIAKSKKIVRYLDIPIQHINNIILKAMRRPDSKDQLKRLIEKLRSAMPDIILRTTVIIGFPGETDQQFTELLDFIKWAKFDALGCFSFYPESGTTAAQMPNQVPEKIKQQRLHELMLTQQEIAFTKNKNRIGSQLTCLVDAVDSENEGRGRFYGQAPDIDSVCIIKKCQAQPGEFINTKVIDTKDYDLIVEQI
ncbi:MAG: 30S ribosomal protein S12 methylthiotransferase RimO [Sedimentisphaerales bacterium]|nr:30S ribosomal protein S12 methylthiotransferase RimO [Sedimentisphaerales bacterium]